MSGAGSLVTHLHSVVGTRQVAVRYVVNKEGRIVPTVSQERIRSWVTSLSTPEERTPVNAINDVDSAGTVLQLARPGKAGRKAGNIEPATTALVQGLGQGRSVNQQISWNELPHSSENRVVPNGPERFAYQAKAGEKWVDVNLTDSTLTAYEGQKVVYGPILINHGGVGHETVTGTYKIYLRYQAQDMGCTPEWPYCERGVPWVSYWHDSYALHGALAGSAGQDVGQDRRQCAEGLSPVGDGVLLLRCHLGGGAAPTPRLVLLDGHEDRIVAESPLPQGGAGQAPLHGALDGGDQLRLPAGGRLD